MIRIIAVSEENVNFITGNSYNMAAPALWTKPDQVRRGRKRGCFQQIQEDIAIEKQVALFPPWQTESRCKPTKIRIIEF